VDTRRLRPPLRLRDPATILVDLRQLTRHEVGVALANAAATMSVLWAERADVRLTVLGHVPFGAAGRLATDPRVVFTGPVQDAAGHLGAATLVLTPVEPLVGLPVSVLEALASATPLVTGSTLAADLGAAPGEVVLAADTPVAQAGLALALLDDPPYRGRLGRAGRSLVEQSHSPERTLEALEHVYAAATGSAIAEWRLELGMDRPRLEW
jgi:glycosyltransferase involved in cell wall biosynthesis